MSDAQLLVGEGKMGVEGTYDLVFQGQAKVTAKLANATFTAGDRTWQNVLPSGAAYDQASNTTHANVAPPGKKAFGSWISHRRIAAAARGRTAWPACA